MADVYAAAPFFVDPWTTTWLPRHYPAHHHPFEHTRHAIGHAFKGLADFTSISASPHTLACPSMDVRESETMFYFDVDLPGLKEKKDMTLKWVSQRTLLLRAVIRRPPTPEDKAEPAEGEKAEGEAVAAAPKEEDKNHHHDGDSGPFMTVHERRVGVFGRAFNFPTDVDHEVTTAKLEAGVLRIAVRKIQEEKSMDKRVSVDMGKEEEDPDETIVYH